jgi:alkylmercury lyase
VLDLFPKLSGQDQRIAVETFRQLAEGLPVPRSAIAHRLKLSGEDVDAFLKSSWDVYCDDANRIIGYSGLSLKKTAHRFTIDGKTLYTWCAWDSLFIPQILNRTARVESVCPVTNALISLTVGPERVTESKPSRVLMSMVTPEVARVRENVIANFCHSVHFFASADAATKWTAEHEGTFILDLEEAYALGRRYNGKQFGAALGPE